MVDTVLNASSTPDPTVAENEEGATTNQNGCDGGPPSSLRGGASIKYKSLFDLANESSWDLLLAKLRSPDELATSEVSDEIMQRGELHRIPLHVAASNRPPVEVITTLLEAAELAWKRTGGESDASPRSGVLAGFGTGPSGRSNPSTVAQSDGYYYLTPLHYAAKSNASPEVIRTLIRAGPDALDMTSDYGCTPLSLACQFELDNDGVRVILEEYPKLAVKPANGAVTPFDERMGMFSELAMGMAWQMCLWHLRMRGELPVMTAGTPPSISLGEGEDIPEEPGSPLAAEDGGVTVQGQQVDWRRWSFTSREAMHIASVAESLVESGSSDDAVALSIYRFAHMWDRGGRERFTRQEAANLIYLAQTKAGTESTDLPAIMSVFRFLWGRSRFTSPDAAHIAAAGLRMVEGGVAGGDPGLIMHVFQLADAWELFEMLLRARYHGTIVDPPPPLSPLPRNDVTKEESRNDPSHSGMVGTLSADAMEEETPNTGMFRLIHAAAASVVPPSIVNIALQLHPEAARDLDENGNLPLHLAAESVAVFDEKMEKGDDDDDDEDEEGGSPAQSMIEQQQAARPLITRTALGQILCAFPEAAAVPNSLGRLPLHLALLSGKVWQSGGDIPALLAAAPDSIRTRDVLTHLYPFMLAAVAKPDVGDSGKETAKADDLDDACGPEESMSTIFELLKTCPELVQCGIPVTADGGEAPPIGGPTRGAGRPMKKSRLA